MHCVHGPKQTVLQSVPAARRRAQRSRSREAILNSCLMFEPLLRRSISSTPVHPVLVLIPHSLPSAENLHLLHYDFCLSVRSACFLVELGALSGRKESEREK